MRPTSPCELPVQWLNEQPLQSWRPGFCERRFPLVGEGGEVTSARLFVHGYSGSELRILDRLASELAGGEQPGERHQRIAKVAQCCRQTPYGQRCFQWPQDSPAAGAVAMQQLSQRLPGRWVDLCLADIERLAAEGYYPDPAAEVGEGAGRPLSEVLADEEARAALDYLCRAVTGQSLFESQESIGRVLSYVERESTWRHQLAALLSHAGVAAQFGG